MTVTKMIAVCSLAIALSAASSRSAETLQAERPAQATEAERSRARQMAPLPSDRADFRGRYAPSYRTGPPSYRIRPLYPPVPRSGLGPIQSGYRFAFPLDRYRATAPPPFYYRRMTPYYDGRGYGVPSTSPFRYHRDLDGPLDTRGRY